MPIYEYQCNACGNVFEVTQRMTDPSLKECLFCHKQAVERIISRTSFHLKGGGWYKDGYAATAKGSDSGKSSKETKETSGSSQEAKSDSAVSSSSTAGSK